MQKRGLDELADSLTAALEIVLNLPDFDQIEERESRTFWDGVDFQEWLARGTQARSHLEQMSRLVSKWQKWKKLDNKEESDGA